MISYITKIVSIIGLILTILPSLLVFSQKLDFSMHKHFMLIGMLLWFTTAPFWKKKNS